MKAIRSFLRTGQLLALIPSALLVCQTVSAQVTLTVTPSVISNTYSGWITLQITGLTNGEPVKIGEYYDFNGNGAVDAEDFRMRAFGVTNNQANVIGGITNINVPADWDPGTTTMLVPISFAASPFEQKTVGHYIFRMISPFNNFPLVAATFTVTNSAFSQSLYGTVVTSGSTPVPYAGVTLFNGSPGQGSPIGGTMADSSGHYTLQVPPGTYTLMASKSNYVFDFGTVPAVTVGPGMSSSNNLPLTLATATISGNAHLPAVMVGAQTQDGLIAIGFSDTNGAFTLPVTANQWKVFVDDQEPSLYGLLPHDGGDPSADTSTGNVSNVTFSYGAGTALVYGKLKDGNNQPLAGIRISGYQPNSHFFQSSALTDQNGKYALAVNADTWQIEVDNENPAFANYIFSQGPGNVTFTNGQALRQDFVALPATNQISGYLRDNNGAGLSNIWIWAEANLNGTNGSVFRTGADTDQNGHYVFNVANGAWSVGVNCWGGDNSLPSSYMCPDSQPVSISNNNAVADFVALQPTAHINGHVRNSANSDPVANVGVYVYPTGNNNYYAGYTTTDGSGYYSLDLTNGDWTVGVNCFGNDQSLSSLGYLCVSEQSRTVSNATVAVDFSAQPAPSQITGYVRDNNSNPIANVGVSAYDPSNPSDSFNGNTDGSGHFVLNVPNGTWHVNVACSGGPGTLTQLGFLCVPEQTVSVTNGAVSADFVTLWAPYQISGWVKDTSNRPITNLHGWVTATIGPNDFRQDTYTDANGNFSFQVASGAWTLNVDCGDLSAFGYQCYNDGAIINVLNNSVVTNFVIQPILPLQITTTSLPAGTIGVPYYQQLQATGGQPGYSWGFGFNTGSLPPGLNLYGDGTISGTPSSTGTYDFSVEVWDSALNQSTTNQSLSLTINPVSSDGLRLTDFARLPDGEFQFSFPTSTGVKYTIQYSSDLTSWTSVLTFSGYGGPITITDPGAPGQPRRFYRVKAAQ